MGKMKLLPSRRNFTENKKGLRSVESPTLQQERIEGRGERWQGGRSFRSFLKNSIRGNTSKSHKKEVFSFFSRSGGGKAWKQGKKIATKTAGKAFLK